MKITFTYLTFLISLFLLGQSCKKNSNQKITATTVNATIKANELYQYDLGSFGFEDGATLSRQATHFKISVLEREPISGKIIYKYAPALNYIGSDEVEVKSMTGSNGSSPGTTFLITTIKFTITN